MDIPFLVAHICEAVAFVELFSVRLKKLFSF